MAQIPLLLEALQYPGQSSFDVSDADSVRQLVNWVENTKARHYAIPDRAALQTSEGAAWDAALTTYLQALDCPVARETANVPAVVQWLLSHAVSLQYSDATQASSSLRECVERCVKSAPEASEWTPEQLPPFPDLDCEAVAASLRAAGAALSSLASASSSAADAASAEELQRLRGIVRGRLQPLLAALSTARPEAGAMDEDASSAGPLDACTPADLLRGTPLGFATGDADVDAAAKALRILHVRDLVRLQKQIDAALSAVQALTADPRVESGRKAR